MSETQADIMKEISRPFPEHDWLRQLVGEWRFETPAFDGTEDRHEGVETVTAIGDLWIQATMEGDSSEGPHTSVTTLGYDPAQGRFVGTWLGSMMHFLWIYSGHLDETKTTLTLEALGPDFEKHSEQRNYRDIIRILAPDHRSLTGMIQEPDGSWRELMVTHYRRR